MLVVGLVKVELKKNVGLVQLIVVEHNDDVQKLSIDEHVLHIILIHQHEHVRR